MKSVYQGVTHLDQKAYEVYGLSEEILMEHAALGIKKEIDRLKGVSTVLVVCGPGNNGADGIALGRLLMAEYDVSLYLPFGVKSPMARLQLQRAEALGVKISEQLNGGDVIVDALFGSGLNKPLDDEADKLIHILNTLPGYKIACDIPSGLFPDGRYDAVFLADLTLSMGAHKLAYFFDQTKDICGRIVNVDLGLPYEKYTDTTDTYLLEPSDMKLPTRTQHFSHKGSYGHVAVLEGAMPGAPTMTALAALEFGAGLATIVGYEHHDYPYMLMHASHIPSSANVLALGMGLGESSYEERDLLEMCEGLSLVIDADLFSNPMIQKLLESKEKIVLTPHPKEFANLLNQLSHKEMSTDTVLKEKFALAREFSQKFPNTVLLLKGTNTLIAHEGVIYIASLGTPALAKGGSGDILAGMIAALLAQGYDALDATITASIAHSLAAHRVESANYALTPDKLIRQIGLLGE